MGKQEAQGPQTSGYVMIALQAKEPVIGFKWYPQFLEFMLE